MKLPGLNSVRLCVTYAVSGVNYAPLEPFVVLQDVFTGFCHKADPVVSSPVFVSRPVLVCLPRFRLQNKESS